MATNANPAPAFLSVQEAADVLRVSPTTIYRSIKRGDIPAVRLSLHGPSATRIPTAELEAWVQRQIGSE